MQTAHDVQTHLNTLNESVLELAAMVCALRDVTTTDPGLRRAAGNVLVEAGLATMSDDGIDLSPGLVEIMAGDATGLAAQASAGILQSAALLSGATAWTTQDDDALRAQGLASAQGAQMFKMFAVPMMEGLGDLLAGPSPMMLDVGVGVAAMAVAWCRTFPQLRVVGLDVFPRALELAHRTVREAGVADRIELRHQDVSEIDDHEQFCLGWLPAPFVPRTAIAAGLRRVVAALVPGGWIVLGHGKFGDRRLSGALTRFQTVAFGGTPLDADEAQDLLRGVGLELVSTLPTPDGAPGISVGRRPLDPYR
jgi:hypothetical protein